MKQNFYIITIKKKKWHKVEDVVSKLKRMNCEIIEILPFGVINLKSDLDIEKLKLPEIDSIELEEETITET